MITLDNVNFNYEYTQVDGTVEHFSQKKYVLEGINLNLAEGHIYGFLGENGVGKTTLFGILMGSLHAEGEIMIDGMNPGKNVVALKKEMFLIPDVLPAPRIKVKSMAEMYASLYPNFDMQDFNEMIKMLNVEVDVLLSSLSLGQLKKAYIACALASDTRYLLMDEPTNGLDISSKITFRKLIAAHADENKTIIISTHLVDDVNDLLDSIIMLKDKEVVLSASIEEIGTRLSFGMESEIENPIYRYSQAKGSMCVGINEYGEEGNVDIKLLYLAFLSKTDEMKGFFNPNV